MGHTRLGTIPKTRAWKELASFLAETSALTVTQSDSREDLVREIASRAVNATEAGFAKAVVDQGVREAAFLLTQIALASRHEDWQGQFQELGLTVDADATVFDFAASAQRQLDAVLSERKYRSDTAEMAQMALGEAIIRTVGPHAQNLFGTSLRDVVFGIREVSTKKGFAQLGQAFFSAFTYRFINFHLSRVSASQLGGSIPQVGELTKFNDALRLHCDQTAFIVRDFCGEWYSKTQFKEGITRDNTKRFVVTAVKKLREEIRRQGAADE